MSRKALLTSALLSAVALLPAQRASADLGEALAVGIIGVGIGCATGALNCRGNQRQQTVRRSSGVSSATRQQNAEVQTALNYFNYPVGTVDGALGPRSRSAISQYQAEMGFPPTGYLQDQERAFLVGSYNRAASGAIGPHAQAMAQGGTRGLLRSFNDERLGQFAGYGQPGYPQPGVIQPGQFPQPAPGADFAAFATPVAPGQMPAPQPIQQAAVPQVLTPQPVPQTVPQPAPVAAAPALALPTLSLAAPTASMVQFCEETSRISIANGGAMTAGNVSNAAQALGEQFCLARSFSVARGEQMMAAVQGMTATDVRASCDQVAAALGATAGGLGGMAPDAAVAAVRGVAGSMAQADMVNLGEICLGSGLSDDKPSVTLSAALLLVAADRTPYAEIVGHHLQNGFGTTANPAAAQGWYQMAVAAVDAGIQPDILPTQAGERYGVIRAAMGGGGTAAPAGLGALPTLQLAPAGN